MPFGLDGQTIGPSTEIILQRQRENEIAGAKLAAQRQQTAQEAQQAQEQIEAQERARVTAELRTLALSQWLGSGGTEQEFKDAWPRLRLQMLEQRALSAEAEERNEYERRIAAAGGRF